MSVMTKRVIVGADELLLVLRIRATYTSCPFCDAPIYGGLEHAEDCRCFEPERQAEERWTHKLIAAEVVK